MLKQEGDAVEMLLTGFAPALVNAIRRTIINNVYTIAIDDVTIYKNTSSMYDEVLASRLGLLPIKTLSSLNKGEKSFTFKLKETGPKAVHASDLICEDEDVKPVYGDMLIINLREGEAIELEAKAVFGNGQDHTKFTPAHVFYHFYPVIDIKKGEVKGAQKIASLCPVDILDGNGNKLTVKKGKLPECILCKACEDYAGSDVIKISSDTDRIVMNVESWNQLETKEILKEAISALETEVKEIAKKV